MKTLTITMCSMLENAFGIPLDGRQTSSFLGNSTTVPKNVQEREDTSSLHPPDQRDFAADVADKSW
jgi:hypothetical protein